MSVLKWIMTPLAHILPYIYETTAIHHIEHVCMRPLGKYRVFQDERREKRPSLPIKAYQALWNCKNSKRIYVGINANQEISFLVACTRLYSLLCWSVGRSVGRSDFYHFSFFQSAPVQSHANVHPCIRPF